MKTFKYSLLFSLILALFAVSCEDLDVPNENDPDFATAFSNPSDIRGVAGSLVNTWFLRAHDYNGPALGLWVAADAGTCSWGNAGMRVLSNEPRMAFDNTPAYQDAAISENFYKGMFGVLSSANEVLGKTEIEGVEIVSDEGVDETKMVSAFAHFAQGISLGYIGLLFDQAFVTSEYTDLTQEVPLSPYTDVIDSALVFLDKCIAICESETFDVPDNFIPGISLDETTLGQLANSFAARILAYSPRNASENAAVNWQQVYDYASAGIDYDFSPLADDITWYTLYHTYANFQGWGQADMRIIHMMDPNMPETWPGANGFEVIPAPVETYDAAYDNRIIDDFQFLSSCPFRAERGYYHFSCYRFSRRDEYLSTWVTTMPDMYKAENDLLIAEAALELGNLAEAASIINNGTRVTRGGLPTIGATATEIDDAIYRERLVELFCSGLGIEFCTLRKKDLLQEGSFLHFPIPGQQLEVNNMDNYTFGPETGRPGIDYSTGGWNQ
jgi:hypothetical protein